MLFAVVATYTAAEGMLAYKKTVEQDGASAGAREVTPKANHQQASDAAPLIQPIDVEAAYEATIRKHVDKHADGVHRLHLEMQRIERHLKVLQELKADQDRRLELARQP
jgi:hypothetical protein